MSTIGRKATRTGYPLRNRWWRTRFTGAVLLAIAATLLVETAHAEAPGMPEIKLCDLALNAALVGGDPELGRYLKACSVAAKKNRQVRGDLITQRANALKLSRGPAQAASEYDAMFALDGSRARTLRYRCSFYIANNLLREALADANELLQLDDNAENYVRRAKVYWHLNDYDQALSDANSALALNSRFIPALQQRSYAYQSMRNYDAAREDLRAAIDIDDTDKWLKIDLADVECDLGNFDRALDLYNKMLDADASDFSALTARGNFYLHRKHDEARALADFTMAVRVAPWGSIAHANMAVLLIGRQQYAEALAEANKAVELEPSIANNYSVRGLVRRLSGDLTGALVDLDKSVQIAPLRPITLINRGNALRQIGRYSDALIDFDAALLRCSDCVSALTGRGMTHESMGQIELARADFEKAIAVPQNQISEQTMVDDFKTAEARLEALQAGTQLPKILPAPGKSGSVIPTPAAPLPQPMAPDAAGKRVALVIGNSHYKNVGALPNPEKDAAALAASLKNIGFSSVTLVTDVTRESLAQGLRAFAAEADTADWAVVYYAGHGVEVGGVNYLVPVDAKLAVDRDVQFEAIPLDQIMAAVEQTKKLKLILLDACRNNPFIPQMQRTAAAEPAQRGTGGATIGTRSVGRGLGDINPGGGTLVVYAAKHGQLALDGEGANSPFVVALLQRLATPGVDITKIFRLVRDDVMEMTAGRQEPYTYGSISGREDFYFVAK